MAPPVTPKHAGFTCHSVLHGGRQDADLSQRDTVPIKLGSYHAMTKHMTNPCHADCPMQMVAGRMVIYPNGMAVPLMPSRNSSQAMTKHMTYPCHAD